jgi:hypothetical protein
MRPELAGEYRSIVAGYKREGWGIYDDSPDLRRAIAMSDAYYGDMSSVAALFKKCGKDILIQNVSCAIDTRSPERVRFLDFCDSGDNLWFTSFDSNCLCRFDKGGRAAHLVEVLPTHEIYERFRSVCNVGGKLFLAPVFAQDIVTYDIARNQLEVVPIAPMSTFCSRPAVGSPKFVTTCQVGRHIFFIPLAYGALVRCDAETGAVDYFDDYIPELSDLAFSDDAYWFSNGIAVGESIYMPASCANAVVEFSAATCKSTVFPLGGGRVGYKHVCFDGTYFWLMHHSGDAVSIWSKGRGIVRTIPLPNVSPHNWLYRAGGAVMRVACRGDLSFEIIDPAEDYAVASIRPALPSSARSGLGELWPDNSAALCCRKEGDKLYVYSASFDHVYVCDMNGCVTDEFSTEMGPADIALLNSYHGGLIAELAESTENALYCTEDFFSLKLAFYIEYIARHSVNGANGAKSGGPACGGAILASLKRHTL